MKATDIGNTSATKPTVRPQLISQGQNESDLQEARFRKLEEDMKKIFRKLDEINFTNYNFIPQLNIILQTSYYLHYK